MSRASGDKARPYRMTRRAERVNDTRLRIVEAAVALHGSVGPAGTTVMAIAEQAGVTRATVYRHFADDAALFEACSAHWLTRQVPPDPEAWSHVADPVERVRAGLADLYRFYRAGEAMLTRIYRDKASLPVEHRRGLDARERRIRDLLLAGFRKKQRTRGLSAALGHAVSYWTWRSLCIGQGLPDPDAVELMTGLALIGARGIARVAGPDYSGLGNPAR